MPRKTDIPKADTAESNKLFRQALQEAQNPLQKELVNLTRRAIAEWLQNRLNPPEARTKMLLVDGEPAAWVDAEMDAAEDLPPAA